MEVFGPERKFVQVEEAALPIHWEVELNDDIADATNCEHIFLSKYRPKCVFCGNNNYITQYKDTYICRECLSSLGDNTITKPRTMKQKVTDIIREMGIPAHLKGYYYLRDAILLFIENDEFKGAITTKLYPLIAQRNHTTSTRVERSIRHCLSIACNRGNRSFINHFFGSGKAEQGITNKLFIISIADSLK